MLNTSAYLSIVTPGLTEETLGLSAACFTGYVPLLSPDLQLQSPPEVHPSVLLKDFEGCLIGYL